MFRVFSVVLLIVLGIVPASRAQWVKLNESYSGSNRSFVKSGSHLFAGTSAGVFLSTDVGTSWTVVNSGLPKMRDVEALAISGSNLFAAIRDAGIFVSTNNGTSWQASNSGLPDSPIPEVRDFAVSDKNIFAGTANGIFLSTNGGASWSEANNGATDRYILTLAVSGKNLFVGTQNDGIFLSSDNGTSWIPTNNGIATNNISAIAVSGTNIFAVSYGHSVFLSTNEGASWSAVNTGLDDLHVHALAVSDSILFAGTIDGVYLSKDNGASWAAVLANVVDYALTISGNYVFAGTDSYVYRRSLSELISSHSVLSIHANDGDSLWFGNIAVGADSLRSVTVSDTGSVPVTIGSFQLTSGQTDFVTSDLSSAVVLLPGESFTFQILFLPSTPGYHTAKLSLLSEGHINSLKLSGIGLNTAGVHDAASKRTLSIYPNPTTVSTSISVTPETSGYAEISIVNMLGQEVARVYSGVLDTSEHTFIWEAQAKASATGEYECVVRMNGKTQMLPIVVD